MTNSEVNKAISFLEKGEIILCPTDTIWGISCNATNFEAVEKIYALKKREKSKSLIVLVSSLEMLQNYVSEIPNNVLDIINSHQKPLTIIYSGAKNIASNAFAQDNSIAIRIVKEGFCHQLIATYGKPIISTSANFSNEPTASSFEEINKLLIEKIKFVVAKNFGNTAAKASTIIKLENNNIITIRE